MGASTPAPAMPGRDELVDFVYREARLLDEKRFDEWFALFTEDGYYWVPLTPGQPDGIDHASLAYEDSLLLQLRIERLKSPRAFSQQPPSRPHHVLQRPELDAHDPSEGTWTMRTPMIYVEARGDEQLVLAATVFHTLVLVDGRLRIRLKRVNLLNSDAALPSIQLFL